MGFNDVNSYLNSRGLPSSKFESKGDSNEGYIKDVELQVVTNTTGDIQFKKDGTTPKEQLVITWLTNERDPKIEKDSGLRKLYCGWRLEAEIKKAFRAAGAEGIEPDAHLKVTFTDTEKVTIPGSTAKGTAKLYSAEYKRPDGSAPVTPGDEEWAADAPAPDAKDYAPSAESIKTAKAMWEAGIQDEAIISQATGIPADYLLREVLSI